MHFNLPKPLILPFTSQSSSKNLSDVLKNEVKHVTLIPCCNLSATQRAHSQVCVCVTVSPGPSVQWG